MKSLEETYTYVVIYCCLNGMMQPKSYILVVLVVSVLLKKNVDVIKCFNCLKIEA